VKTAIVVSLAPTSFEALALSSDVTRAFDLAAECGFDGVEIAVRDPDLVSGPALARLARDHGLEIVAIGTGQAYLAEGLSLTHAAQRVRRATVELLKKQLDLGRALGAQVIIGLIRGTAAGKDEVQPALDRLREGLHTLEGHARAIGAPGLLLEPINRYETRLLNSVPEAVSFLAGTGWDSVRILADTFHMNIEDRDPVASLELAGSRLGHVHLADSNRWAPGQGHLDFGPLFALLEKMRYSGYLSAEILPLPSPEEAVRLTADFFRVRGLLPPKQ
jgi:sugar phosphate isomerase/epimerase